MTAGRRAERRFQETSDFFRGSGISPSSFKGLKDQLLGLLGLRRAVLKVTVGESSWGSSLN